MYISESICKILEALGWPMVVLIISLYVIKKIPEYLGVFNYKHLSLMTQIKDQIYCYAELYRSNLENGILSQSAIEKIYDNIINNYAKYDLATFQKQYISLYPELKTLKLAPIKKKARTFEEKKAAVNNYLSNLNCIITQMLSVENFRDREQLLQFLQLIPVWINALK